MKRFKNSRGRPADGRLLHSHLPPGRCVVGIHAVRELLKVRPRAVSQLWLRDRYQDHPDLKALSELAQRSKIEVLQQPVGALDKVIGAHQGVLAFTEEQPQIDWRDLEIRERAMLLALDEVEDPHNLGAVMRTAWLFGAQGILTPEHRAAHLSPAVSKVAQGAAEYIAVERDSALPQQLETLKKWGFWVLGLSHKSKQTLFNFEIPAKVVWVLGSESGGLRKSVEGVCDDLIAIPQTNAEASFNVSVAAGVALAETFRQANLK